MSAVAAHTEGVDTLAAWLTAHLAAPDTATKAYFTVFDLLEAAGIPHNSENLSSMARAAGRAGLIQARRYADGALLRAWFRRPHALLAQQAAARLDEQEAQARQRVRDYIDCAADWALMSHRVQTRDIRDRMDEALARHRRTAKAILHRLAPGASSDPAPRIVDIASLADFVGHLYPLTDWQRQNLNFWEASHADRRARPRGARP